MSADSLANFALAVGTVAGLFLTLAIGAGGVVYQATRDALREAQRDAWTLVREAALMVSGLDGELLALLAPRDGIDPLDVVSDLAKCWTAVGSAEGAIEEPIRAAAVAASKAYKQEGPRPGRATLRWFRTKRHRRRIAVRPSSGWRRNVASICGSSR